jgi:hypothetical protein
VPVAIWKGKQLTGKEFLSLDISDLEHSDGFTLTCLGRLLKFVKVIFLTKEKQMKDYPGRGEWRDYYACSLSEYLKYHITLTPLVAKVLNSLRHYILDEVDEFFEEFRSMQVDTLQSSESYMNILWEVGGKKILWINLWLKYLQLKYPKVSFLSKYPISDGISFIKGYPLSDEMEPLESLSIEKGGLKLTSFSAAKRVDDDRLEVRCVTCSWAGNNQVRITGQYGGLYVMIISPAGNGFGVSEGAITRPFDVKAGDFVLVLHKYNQIGKSLNAAALSYWANAPKELTEDGSILIGLVDVLGLEGMLKIEEVGEQ